MRKSLIVLTLVIAAALMVSTIPTDSQACGYGGWSGYGYGGYWGGYYPAYYGWGGYGYGTGYCGWDGYAYGGYR
jgi:hypothetical protein